MAMGVPFPSTLSFLSSSPGASSRFCIYFFQRDENEHYFSRKSLKYWDKFCKLHKNKFFKNRRYLEKDWGNYLLEDNDGAVGVFLKREKYF